MNTPFANSLAYLKEAEKVINSLPLSTQMSFNQARRVVFNAEPLRQLIASNIPNKIMPLSAGTSQRLAFRPYLQQISNDLLQNKYYRDYAPTAGNVEARCAVAYAESVKLQDTRFSVDDVCFTEGSTGAITTLIEVLQRSQPDAQVLIAAPTYYIYKSATEYFGLCYKEVNTKSLMDLVEAITPKTKLIIVCNPSNPQGEIYPREEVKRLLSVAKEKDILVMADELFSELVFDPQRFVSFASVAEEMKCLDLLITVKGFSKSKNLAGLRVGYLVSKNQELLKKITATLEQRQCFPVASIFTGMICLDSFFQVVKVKSLRRGLSTVIPETQKEFEFSETITSLSAKQLKVLYQDFLKYEQAQLNGYAQLYQIALTELSELVSDSTNTQAAFNTFIRIDALRGVDQLDFTVNLYIQTGLKIEIGPCFGWDQKAWQEDLELGFWLRLSFSQDESEYLQALKTFKEFVPYYLSLSCNKVTLPL